MRPRTGVLNSDSYFKREELKRNISRVLPCVASTIQTYFTPQEQMNADVRQYLLDINNRIFDMLLLLEKKELLESAYDNALNNLFVRAINDHSLLSCYHSIFSTLDSLDALTKDNINKVISSIQFLWPDDIKLFSELFSFFYSQGVFDKSNFHLICKRLTPEITLQVITTQRILHTERENMVHFSSCYQLTKEQWEVIFDVADTSIIQLKKFREIFNFFKRYNMLSESAINVFFEHLINSVSKHNALDAIYSQLCNFTYFNFSKNFLSTLKKDVSSIDKICLRTTLSLTDLSRMDETALAYLLPSENNINIALFLDFYGFPIIDFIYLDSEFQKTVYDNFVNIALYLLKNARISEKRKTTEEMTADINNGINELDCFPDIIDFFRMNPNLQTDSMLLEMLLMLSNNKLLNKESDRYFWLRANISCADKINFRHFFRVIECLEFIKHLTHDNLEKTHNIFLTYPDKFYILLNYLEMKLLTNENFNDFFRVLTNPAMLMLLHSFFDFLTRVYNEFRKIPSETLILLIKNYDDVVRLSEDGVSIQDILTHLSKKTTDLPKQQTRAPFPVNRSALFQTPTSQGSDGEQPLSPLAQSAPS